MSKAKRPSGMDGFIAGLKDKRIIDTSNSNGLLAAFWARILSKIRFITPEDKIASEKGEEVNTVLDGNRWSRLVDAWAENVAKRHGRDYATNKRGNLIPALMRPTLTWGTLISAISILNATKFFKQIRLEIQFTSARTGDTQSIGIDLYNEEADVKEDPYVTFARKHNVPTLKPGDIVYPMKHYIPEGFNNDTFSNIVLEYTGTEPMTTHADTFHKLSYVDSMVIEATGMCSNNWIRIVGQGRV